MNISIKEKRKAKGLSQSSLAEMVNVTQGAISQWEQGVALPSVDKVVELAKILECEISDLLGVGNAQNVKEG